MMKQLKSYYIIALLLAMLIVILIYILPKPNTQQLIAIQAYQSFKADSFVQQHQLLDLSVNQIPNKLLPSVDAKFCMQQFGIPAYYSTQIANKYTDTTIIYQQDTTLPNAMRTTFTEKYNSQKQLENYDINGQQIMYNATYNYNANNQISLITEQQGAVTFAYDSNKQLQTIMQLDKDFKPVKKIELAYIYLDK